MSPFYATHAGMLSYVAREFAELSQAHDDPNARRLAIYASILERMVTELTTERAEPAQPGI